MGLFNFFSGKSPSDYERQGDALARDKSWGEAKLAFEAGLEKLTTSSSDDPDLADRLRAKLVQTKESLALAHRQEAAELLDAGCVADANELLMIAVDLTTDSQLKADLTQLIEQTMVRVRPVVAPYDTNQRPSLDEPVMASVPDESDDYFDIVLGALPEDIQDAYRGYGDHFKRGYLALNRGDFGQAVEDLKMAFEENPSPDSLIPLELATAHVNLGQGRQARVLLEDLIQHRSDLLPAYQLLCELYWETKEFDLATELLDTLPPDLAKSMGAYMLRGETLLQATRYPEAQSFFQGLFQNYGWHDDVALGMARAHEHLGQASEARDVYGKLIAQCGSGCGSRIDPALKRKYADLSLETGQYTTDVLEYYLELSREDPANALQYCQRISLIYAELGNEDEALRFQTIAAELARKS